MGGGDSLFENEASLPRMYSEPYRDRESSIRLPEGALKSFSCPPARNKLALFFSVTFILWALV